MGWYRSREHAPLRQRFERFACNTALHPVANIEVLLEQRVVTVWASRQR